jgi:hypothetical protein
MTVHRIDILPDKRGYGRPAMIYNGKPVGKSNSPIYAAARWLLDHGAALPADMIETWGSDGILSMYGIAGELSKWTVVENDDGDPTFELRRYKPFPSSTVGPRAAKNSLGGTIHHPINFSRLIELETIVTRDLDHAKATRQKLRDELASLAKKREKLNEAGIALAAAEHARDEFEASESDTVSKWASAGCSGARPTPDAERHAAPQELGYDGSLSSLIRIFREHAGSPFHRMTAASRAQYSCILGVISRNHGGYLVRSLTWFDVLNWHALWSSPIGIDSERLAGGRLAFFVLKAALSFGRACGLADCRALLDEIAASGFRAPCK